MNLAGSYVELPKALKEDMRDLDAGEKSALTLDYRRGKYNDLLQAELTEIPHRLLHDVPRVRRIWSAFGASFLSGRVFWEVDECRSLQYFFVSSNRRLYLWRRVGHAGVYRERAAINCAVVVRGNSGHDGTSATAFPGPVAANMAFLAGKRLAGIAGSFCALLGTVIPPFLTILLLSQAVIHFMNEPWLAAFFLGAPAQSSSLSEGSLLQYDLSPAEEDGKI